MTTQNETQTEIVQDGYTLDKAAMSAGSMEQCANGDTDMYTERGDYMTIEFLSASSGYTDTTVVEGRLVRFHRNKVEMCRTDGTTMTVEVGEFMDSALTVRTNGRKVGTIQGDYDGTGISLLRDNYVRVPVEADGGPDDHDGDDSFEPEYTDDVKEALGALTEGDEVRLSWTVTDNDNPGVTHDATVFEVEPSEFADRISCVRFVVDGWDETTEHSGQKVLSVSYLYGRARFEWTGKRWNGNSPYLVTGVERVDTDGGRDELNTHDVVTVRIAGEDIVGVVRSMNDSAVTVSVRDSALDRVEYGEHNNGETWMGKGEAHVTWDRVEFIGSTVDANIHPNDHRVDRHLEAIEFEEDTPDFDDYEQDVWLSDSDESDGEDPMEDGDDPEVTHRIYIRGDPSGELYDYDASTIDSIEVCENGRFRVQYERAEDGRRFTAFAVKVEQVAESDTGKMAVTDGGVPEGAEVCSVCGRTFHVEDCAYRPDTPTGYVCFRCDDTVEDSAVDATDRILRVDSRDVGAMRESEFWQRVALEALVNDDPAKALAMRVNAFFESDEVTALARQRDSISVTNIRLYELDDWLRSSEFEYATINEENGDCLVRGVEYTAFGDEYDCDEPNNHRRGPDSPPDEHDADRRSMENGGMLS